MNPCSSKKIYFFFGVSDCIGDFKLDTDSIKTWFQLLVVLTVQKMDFSLQ